MITFFWRDHSGIISEKIGLCYIFVFIFRPLIIILKWILYQYKFKPYRNVITQIRRNSTELTHFGVADIWLILQILLSRLLFFYITKTYLYNFDPLKPHFFTVKLGFTGVYIIFLISAQNIDCVYSLEPPRRGGSNEYPQSTFCAEIWKISEFFLSENFQFLEIKFSIYLNRRVFVMHVMICQLVLRYVFVAVKVHFYTKITQVAPVLLQT